MLSGFPVQQDWGLLQARRYVERNALAAKLADRAEAWPWGSAHARLRSPRPGWLPGDTLMGD